MDWQFLVFFFLTAVVANLALMPLALRWAPKLGLMDLPGNRKIHSAPVAKIGGAALLLSALAALAIGFLLFPSEPFMGIGGQKAKLPVLFSGTLLAALLGLADDLWDLKPRQKFLGQAILAVAFSLLGYRFQVLHLPGLQVWGLSFLSVPFTAFWIMGVINGFNFMDGVDSLAGSVILVMLGGLAVASPLLGGHIIQVLAVALLGAMAVFMVYNRKPARVYLGDAGASALGFFTAASLISMGPSTWAMAPTLARAHEPFRFQFLVATLLVGYPFLEAALSTVRRGIKRMHYGRSMEWSEKEHIHHRLLKLGFNSQVICLLGASFSLLMAAAGLLAMCKQNALATLCLVPVLVVLAILMPRMGFFDFLDPKSLSEKKPYYRMAHLFVEMQRVKLELVRQRSEILALISQTCAELGVQGFRLKVGTNGGSCQYHWERPLEIQREYLKRMKPALDKGHFELFRDKVTLEDGQGEAFWIFEPHTVEDELDVEYRVLVSGFMMEALACVSDCGPDTAGDQEIRLNSLSHAKVRSSLLRRRYSAPAAGEKTRLPGATRRGRILPVQMGESASGADSQLN